MFLTRPFTVSSVIERNSAICLFAFPAAISLRTSISPGVIETNQTREQLKDPEWAGYMIGKTLLGRLGRPEEVAWTAVFLASDEAPFINAETIVIDGGRSVLYHD